MGCHSRVCSVSLVTSAAKRGRFCAVMKLCLSLCAFSLALGLAVGQAEDAKKEIATPAEKQSDNKAMNANEVAVIKTTEGEMVVEFWTDVAPKTVENFKTLARKGFYDGTCFHRV